MVKKKNTGEEEQAEEKLDAKETILQATIKSAEKKFGAGIIMCMSDSSLAKKIDVIETGSLMLDKCLGVGGFPRGRIIEVYGGNSVGKTTLALLTAANAQKMGETIIYVDSEFAVDRDWAKLLGVNLDNLYISQPDNAEEALDLVEDFVRSGSVGLIIIDSVSALCPKAEIEGEMGDASVAGIARLMSKALRKLVGAVHESNTCLLFINQTRQNISTFGYGPNEVTSGGMALKFYSSVRVELKNVKTIKEGPTVIGSLIRATVKKNKVAAPFRVCEIPLLVGIGFSVVDELIDELIRLKVVTMSDRGGWFSMKTPDGDIKLGQGRDNVKNWFKLNPEKYEELLQLVKNDSSLKIEEE